MDQKTAAKLLDNTFNQDFDLERFSVFIKELFNHFNLRINKNIPLRKEYYHYIEHMDSLGVYKDNNQNSIEIFAVKLQQTSSRDRARAMQRNLIAKYLKNSGSNAALVAFYGDDPQDWRFSFVKLEYDLVKDEKGNLKVKEDITPARRSSFLVGKNEPNHTCRRQFLSLIKEEDVDPLLEQVEEAFSIENVTNEFFEEYKKLFLKLQESLKEVIKHDDTIRNEFNKKSIPTSDFAKKLMGQIVFIYFLQKKGWLGVDKGKKWGTGPRNFLRKLFNKELVEYENFYNDILEPLFYEALATPRDEDYYHNFDCKIPFLNGGLFEPINDYDWVQTEITLTNQIFKDILDVFDLYNFTIKEDEPLEKEVAVDPEMLGKVFENLLDVKDRKSQGAFYTPREIVHYMCQESLINYMCTNSDLPRDDLENFIYLGDLALDILIREIIEYGKLREDRDYGLSSSIKENHPKLDYLLQHIKVVDPAVGSGAFPVGMMNEIVKARSILSLLSGEEKSNYQLKLETIRDSLYGVDIDSSAVDIAKLRFWLSLIVDEEDIEKIDPLPNIDHKIMCGNSLLEEFDGKKLFDDGLLGEIIADNSDELENIKKKRDQLYMELGMIHTGKINDKTRKNDIEKEIKKLDLKEKKLESLNQDIGKQFTLDDDYETRRIKESQRKLKELDKLHKKFFKEQNTKKKKKYRHEFERIEWEFIEETLREDGNENSILKLEDYKKNKSKPFFLWKLYFAEVFQRENPGFDIVIANPPYIRQEKIKELKPFLKNKYKTYTGVSDLYVYFFENGINVLREGGILTFISSNTWMRTKYGKKVRSFFSKNLNPLKLINFEDAQIFSSAIVETSIILIQKMQNQNFLKAAVFGDDFKEYNSISRYLEVKKVILDNLNSDPWIILPKEHLKIKIKLEENSPRLKEISDLKFYRGILTGYNDAFLIDKKTKDKLIKEDSKSSEIIKPLLRGRNIGRWFKDFKEQYLIFTRRGIDINEFPAIKNHLEQFKERLTPKNQGQKIGRKPGDYEWYEIQDTIGYYKEFDKEKIVWLAITDQPKFALDKGSFVIAPAYIMVSNFNRYLLAILNSKVSEWYLDKITSSTGMGTNQWTKIFVEQLPILKVAKEEQRILEVLVDDILEFDGQNGDNLNNHPVIKEIENKINQKVYQLYDLTNEEIDIIENDLKRH